ncbi:MAG: ammonium transporter, partial [Pseudomonadota bacterium]
QLTGIAAYGVFTFVASLIVWIILKGIMGIRVGEEEELAGLDVSEMGMEAYPDFSKG